MKTYTELLKEAQAQVHEIAPPEALALHYPSATTLFVDVRDPQEFNLGRIPNALTISRGNLESKIEVLV